MKVVSIAIAGICILSLAGSAFAERYNQNNRNHQGKHYEQISNRNGANFRQDRYRQNQKQGQWCNMYDYSRWGQRPNRRHDYYHNYYNPYFNHHNWKPKTYCTRPVIYVYNGYGTPIR